MTREPDDPRAPGATFPVQAVILDDVDEFRGGADDPDQLEQRAISGWDQRPFRSFAQLPAGELDHAVEYNDGSDEKFLRRPWHDLYGDEPIVGS
jgi:hypothetical protein